MPLDREVAARLRQSGKPVIVAVNKVDTCRAETGADEFAALGFANVLPVSAIHGEGIENLMDAAFAFLPPAPAATAAEAEAETPAAEPGEPGAAALPAARPAGPLKIAIVGRPNVGKSSIINALTHSERVIVCPIPGTTRDSVDVPFEVETDGVRSQYILIDTAGLRKARRVDDSIEFFSAQRAEESIARCDIAVLVLDAETGILEQDKKIADKIVEERRRASWWSTNGTCSTRTVRDGAQGRDRQARRTRTRREGRQEPMTTLSEFGAWVQENLFFLDYAPVIFTSAKSGFHLDRLLEAVRYVAAQLQQKIPTALLNRTLQRRRGTAPARQRFRAPPQILLRHPGPAVAAHLPALCQPRRAFSDSIQKEPGRRDAQGLRLRRLPPRARAQAPPENRGPHPQIPRRPGPVHRPLPDPPPERRPETFLPARQTLPPDQPVGRPLPV